MALQYVTSDGTLIVPGAYVKLDVSPQNAGLGTTGVLMLVGEADSGPSYVDEGAALYLNAFGPDQKDAIVSKYLSGPIVDAYCIAATASADPQIQGAFSRCVVVKTNQGLKASSSLLALAKADGTFAGGTAGLAYGTLAAKIAGAPGNMIVRSVTSKVDEVLPTTGAFILASPWQSTSVSVRVNGGAATTPATFTAGETPAAMVAAINAMTTANHYLATGGVTRGTIFNTTSVVFTADGGMAAHITGTFVNLPQVNDIVVLAASGAFAAANEGTYWCSASTTGRIDLVKLYDGNGATLLAPTTETVTCPPSDCIAYTPVTITVSAGNPIAGLGKSLEIANTSTGSFSSLCFVAPAAGSAVGSLPTAATFVSTTTAPCLVASSAEYVAQLNLVRQADNTNQQISFGGDVILTMGYTGTTAQAVISGTTMTLTLVGGTSASLSPISVDLTKYKTVADLCQYLNTLGGFNAKPALANRGSIASVNLDDGTYNFATDKGVGPYSSTTDLGVRPGRIKADGYAAAFNIVNNSTLVDVVPPGVATKLDGLPVAATNAFLTGGSKGATTQANIQGAVDALQHVRGNFVVPLFSSDATVDIAAGTTDASSTYTIDAINAACKSHCLQMSTMKRSRPRQAFLSKDSTFANGVEAASNTSQPRCSFFFQKIIKTDASGNLTTFKPWAKAVVAAGMQAAGGYRDLTGKYIDISGVVDPVGYNNQNMSNEETALLAGLMPIVHEEDGGYTWVSDQTTYTADANFFFNSTQAVYAGDVVAMTAKKRMERAFKGQSLADVSAATGKVVLKSILDELKNAKWLAPSNDAPAGYKEPVVNIRNGNAMVCSAEIKVSTGIKFIPISFLVTPITDSTQ
jgi:hypothetical protein